MKRRRALAPLISRWHRLPLLLGCVLVLLLLGSSHWQAEASRRALGDLRRQAERVQHLDSMLIQLMDAENAVRGYLLSGNNAHLEPYRRNLETVSRTMEQIRRDLSDDPANDDAVADLAGLVAIKLRSLEQAVGRGMAGEETRSQGKRYTDRIRQRIFDLQAQLAAEGETSFQRSVGHVDRTRWVLAAFAAGTLALMLILFFVVERQFSLREQLAGLLKSENQRLDALVQARTSELSDLASYLTNARESEKARLARELHDELGALLTAAKMETGWLQRRQSGAAVGEHLARLDHLLEEGIALKRRIIDGLRPPLLEALGLVSTLAMLGEDFTCGGEEALRLELPEDEIEPGPALALAVFRLAQEALTNIRKHAAARQVLLALRHRAGCLELEVADDGRGFLPDAGRGRHGLVGMKHRVQMHAGQLRVESQPGIGTRIVARLPLPAASACRPHDADSART